MCSFTTLLAKEKRGKEKKKSCTVEDNAPLVAPLFKSPDKLRLQEDRVSRKPSNGSSATKLKSLQMLPYAIWGWKYSQVIFQNIIHNVWKLTIHTGKKSIRLHTLHTYTQILLRFIPAKFQPHNKDSVEEFNTDTTCIRPFFFFSISYLQNEQTGKVDQVIYKTDGKCHVKQSFTFFCFSPL